MSLEITKISAANSTTTALGGGGTFTGVYEDVTNWVSVQFLIKTDQTGTFSVTWSTDGVNADRTFSASVTDTTNGVFTSSGIRARYLRVSYTNGGVAQGYLRLQTMYSPGTDSGSLSQLSEVPGDWSVALLTKTQLVGRDSGLVYRNVPVSTSGYLQVDGSQVTQPVSGTVVTSTTGYVVRLDEASATITYVGQAVPTTLTSAASWSIKRLDSTTGLIVLWGGGTAAFTQIWDNRAALAYS